MRNGKQSHHAPKPRDADQSVNNTDRIDTTGSRDLTSIRTALPSALVTNVRYRQQT